MDNSWNEEAQRQEAIDGEVLVTSTVEENSEGWNEYGAYNLKDEAKH